MKSTKHYAIGEFTQCGLGSIFSVYPEKLDKTIHKSEVTCQRCLTSLYSKTQKKRQIQAFRAFCKPLAYETRKPRQEDA